MAVAQLAASFGWPLVAGTGWDWTDILADVWGVVVGLALKLI